MVLCFFSLPHVALQWFALTRRHAAMVVDDVVFYDKFVQTNAEVKGGCPLKGGGGGEEEEGGAGW